MQLRQTDLLANALPWFKGKLDYRAYYSEDNSSALLKAHRVLDFYTLVADIARAKNTHDIRKLCYQITFQYGFNHFGLAYLLPDKGQFKCHHINGEVNGWTDYYQKRLMFGDPFTDHCLRKNTPLLWLRNNKQEKYLLSTAPIMVDAISQFSIGNILSVPCHLPKGRIGCLRLMNKGVGSAHQLDIAKSLPELHLLTAHLIEAMYRLFEQGECEGRRGPSLTKRELQVLRLISYGNTNHQIAAVLTISENTAQSHIKSIFRKLQVSNRQLAIARGISLGLLEELW